MTENGGMHRCREGCGGAGQWRDTHERRQWVLEKDGMCQRVKERMRIELMHMVDEWKNIACVMHGDAGGQAVEPVGK